MDSVREGEGGKIWENGIETCKISCMKPKKKKKKNTGVGCHSLLQGIFPNQGLNLDLLHYRQILYCLSYQGSLFFFFLILPIFPRVFFNEESILKFTQ